MSEEERKKLLPGVVIMDIPENNTKGRSDKKVHKKN